MSDFSHMAWPKVKVKYVTFDNRAKLEEQRKAARYWLIENNVEFKEQPTLSIFTFDLHIKDPKYLMLYKLKFGDTCVN